MGDAKTARTVRGAKRGTVRRRAVGTRDRIISHLTAVGDITDPAGMASTKLAEAVGYPGSSVAFAQLLSGMERDGLVAREVRGKRTYRITLPEGVAAAYAAKAAGQVAADVALGAGVPLAADVSLGAAADLASAVAVAAAGSSGTAAGFDYDELARRLLVQVLRKLASPSVADAVTGAGLAAVDAAAAVAERPVSGETERAAREKTGKLEETVASLERELSAAWTRHGTLTAENARLREQLSQAQRALELERARRAPLSGELNEAEVVVLERLLDPSAEDTPGAMA